MFRGDKDFNWKDLVWSYDPETEIWTWKSSAKDEHCRDIKRITFTLPKGRCRPTPLDKMIFLKCKRISYASEQEFCFPQLHPIMIEYADPTHVMIRSESRWHAHQCEPTLGRIDIDMLIEITPNFESDLDKLLNLVFAQTNLPFYTNEIDDIDETIWEQDIEEYYYDKKESKILRTKLTTATSIIKEVFKREGIKVEDIISKHEEFFMTVSFDQKEFTFAFRHEYLLNASSFMDMAETLLEMPKYLHDCGDRVRLRAWQRLY